MVSPADFVVSAEVIKLYLAKLPRLIEPVDIDEVRDDNIAKLDENGKGFFLMAEDVQPDDYTEAIKPWSTLFPDVTFRVEAYQHEVPDSSSSNSYVFLVRDGKEINPFAEAMTILEGIPGTEEGIRLLELSTSSR